MKFSVLCWLLVALGSSEERRLVEKSGRNWRLKVPERCCPEEVYSHERRVVLPKVLLGVVTSSSERSKALLLSNVLALREFSVSWVALLYDGTDGSSMEDIRSLKGVDFQAYDARLSPTDKCPFCPKFSMQASLSKFAKDFDYVILPDADISFKNFDWRRYWTLHAAAGAPLVSQPLIRQNTQHVDFFVNLEQWEACLRPQAGGEKTGENLITSSLFARSKYIENQVPFLDATFFSYFVSETRGFTAYQRDLGTDWGQTRAWCAVAAVFFANKKANNTICALLFEAIDHNDNKDIPKTSGFRKAGSLAQTTLQDVLHGRDYRSASKLNMTNLATQTATILLTPYIDTVAQAKRCMDSTTSPS